MTKNDIVVRYVKTPGSHSKELATISQTFEGWESKESY